ncbi:hypothetical protein GE061_014194 [Apolygus lucorum]|uniref:dolichol kinase n=1 Tax=Apolygus lucorum TaxID=248454 RepID=A0A8S9XS02_APOLU|nr:hypothetical protein GE061_014194 [Apolygus lucorum]
MAHSFLHTINKHISSYLVERGIEPRRHAGSGVWLSALLPFCIIRGELTYDTSAKYKVASCISTGLLFHSLIVMARSYNHKLIQPVEVFFCCITSILSLYFFSAEGIFLSALYGSLSVYTYHTLILPLMKLCPRSFSYGEATIACQGFVLFLFIGMISEQHRSASCYTVTTTILQCGNACMLGLAACAYHLELKRKPLEFYSLLSISVLALLVSLYFLIGENPLFWILALFSKDMVTVWLILFWVVCTCLALGMVSTQISSEKKANTVTRKIFHLLSLLVFVPGIILKPCTIYLASGVAFALLLALDMLRVLDMPPFGKFLQLGFLRFVDEKDDGPLALTPVYLLVGCALPLWIHPDLDKGDLLPLFAGLLSIGVGDSAASTCGTFVGKNRWPGSKKTKEGTAACFLSQLFLVIFLIHIGYVPRTNLIKPTFAIATSSIVEAKTDQVDNIVLPLMMYAMML